MPLTKRKKYVVNDVAGSKRRKTSKATSVESSGEEDSRSASSKKVEKRSYPKEIPKEVLRQAAKLDSGVIEYTAKLPARNTAGKLVFEDWQEFLPNMTPEEVIRAGSFGGTYFRPIHSGITKKDYSGVWKELPRDWLDGVNIPKLVSSPNYDVNVNTYKAKCGGGLDMWESSGWIHPQDPYGWFQWYCRFYQGRRSDDDARQVGRWLRCAGTTGRWRNNLISKCLKNGSAYNDEAVSPVVRQVLQHWAYKLTERDFDAYAKKKGK